MEPLTPNFWGGGKILDLTPKTVFPFLIESQGTYNLLLMYNKTFGKMGYPVVKN
jgi:hypothetical protein